ncbi:hypothetical protein JX265_012878 [Neoarthrinium moseri]|uniref:Uncharacterized protein n=1 Tax=Neoarthrinium moseri TaxID=1658444 RepID=A0A9P9W9H6_9PEZI|nr:uncharacterized protein JN550_009739 [Neoarthrinium moseri]KAI1841001.1 hypothetical protein JX266_012782 [Neoarthrinium moseri]KAI1852989.1 hypothetical protein JX265_012878 [Neoarthrinium moseri]KAI1863213.1 hypothetical protein JN550_009739 [Neoarthrinium moseri]
MDSTLFSYTTLDAAGNLLVEHPETKCSFVLEDPNSASDYVTYLPIFCHRAACNCPQIQRRGAVSPGELKEALDGVALQPRPCIASDDPTLGPKYRQALEEGRPEWLMCRVRAWMTATRYAVACTMAMGMLPQPSADSPCVAFEVPLSEFPDCETRAQLFRPCGVSIE